MRTDRGKTCTGALARRAKAALAVLLAAGMALARTAPAAGSEHPEGMQGMPRPSIEEASAIEGAAGAGGGTAAAPSVSGEALHVSGNAFFDAYSSADPYPMSSNGAWYMVRRQKWMAGPGAASSDSRIVSVSKKGLAVAKSPGKATITLPGGSLDVTVIDIKANAQKIEMKVGDIAEVSLGTDATDAGLKPEWTTDNPGIAQVHDGKVVATGAGSTRINAWLGGVRLRASVKVKGAGEGATASVYVAKGRSAAIKGFPKGTAWSPASGNSAAGGTEAGMGSAAVDAKGRVKGGSAGTVRLEDGAGHSAIVHVEDPGYPKEITVAAGDRVLLSDGGNDSMGGWMSSKPAVASMSGYGVLHGISEGKCSVSAKIGGRKVRIKVTVRGQGGVKEPTEWHTYPMVDGLPHGNGVLVHIADNGDFWREVSMDGLGGGGAAEKAAHVAIFNAAGGSFSNGAETRTMSVPDGAPAGSIAETPSRAGYAFAGWADLTDGGRALDPAAPIHGSKFYVGRWEPNRYTVRFDRNADDASGEMEPVEAVYDRAAALPQNRFSRDGHSFSHWSLSSNGSPAGDGIADKGAAFNLTGEPGGTVTLYATWKADAAEGLSHTVMFADDDGSILKKYEGIADGDPLPPGAESEMEAHKEKEGYTWGGWMLEGGEFDFSSPITSAKKEILVVARRSMNPEVIEEKYYSVIYDADGGSFSDGSAYRTSIVYQNGKAPAPEAPSRTGYAFSGRWMDAAGGSAYDFDSEVERILWLKAEWKPNRYTVRFSSPESPAEEAMEPVEMEYGTEEGLPPNAFTYAGYTFQGWAEEEGSNEAAYADGQKVKNLSAEDGASITLHAVWKANPGIPVTIRHFYQNTDGTYGSEPSVTTYMMCYAGESAAVSPQESAGFEVDSMTVKNGSPYTDSTVTADRYGRTVVDYRYRRIACTLTYNTDGITDPVVKAAVPASSTVMFGGKYDTLPALEKDGYNFTFKLNGAAEVTKNDTAILLDDAVVHICQNANEGKFIIYYNGVPFYIQSPEGDTALSVRQYANSDRYNYLVEGAVKTGQKTAGFSMVPDKSQATLKKWHIYHTYRDAGTSSLVCDETEADTPGGITFLCHNSGGTQDSYVLIPEWEYANSCTLTVQDMAGTGGKLYVNGVETALEDYSGDIKIARIPFNSVICYGAPAYGPESFAYFEPKYYIGQSYSSSHAEITTSRFGWQLNGFTTSASLLIKDSKTNGGYIVETSSSGLSVANTISLQNGCIGSHAGEMFHFGQGVYGTARLSNGDVITNSNHSLAKGWSSMTKPEKIPFPSGLPVYVTNLSGAGANGGNMRSEFIMPGNDVTYMFVDNGSPNNYYEDSAHNNVRMSNSDISGANSSLKLLGG